MDYSDVSVSGALSSCSRAFPNGSLADGDNNTCVTIPAGIKYMKLTETRWSTANVTVRARDFDCSRPFHVAISGMITPTQKCAGYHAVPECHLTYQDKEKGMCMFVCECSGGEELCEGLQIRTAHYKTYELCDVLAFVS